MFNFNTTALKELILLLCSPWKGKSFSNIFLQIFVYYFNSKESPNTIYSGCPTFPTDSSGIKHFCQTDGFTKLISHYIYFLYRLVMSQKIFTLSLTHTITLFKLNQNKIRSTFKIFCFSKNHFITDMVRKLVN